MTLTLTLTHRTCSIIILMTLVVGSLVACIPPDQVVNEEFPTTAADTTPTLPPDTGSLPSPTPPPPPTMPPTEPPAEPPAEPVLTTEPVPTAAPTEAPTEVPTEPAPTEPLPTATPAEPVALFQGQFIDIDLIHKGSGTATIYRLADGSHILRFEEFEVTNGPDVFVLLDTSARPTASSQFGEQVNLGMLKGNVGNQNYPIPAETDVAPFKSVVIYCREFDAVMSLASLTPTSDE